MECMTSLEGYGESPVEILWRVFESTSFQSGRIVKSGVYDSFCGV